MDKRHFTRVVFQSEAIVKSKDKTLKGEIGNLSLNGIFLNAPGALPVSEPVEGEIFLSGTTSELALKMEGTVLRDSPEGLAIQFKGMSLDSFIYLKNIISYNRGDEEKVMEEFYEYMRFNETQPHSDEEGFDV